MSGCTWNKRKAPQKIARAKIAIHIGLVSRRETMTTVSPDADGFSPDGILLVSISFSNAATIWRRKKALEETVRSGRVRSGRSASRKSAAFFRAKRAAAHEPPLQENRRLLPCERSPSKRIVASIDSGQSHLLLCST